MNCPTCKNPIQEYLTECEWCGNIIIKESVNSALNPSDSNPNLDFQLLELCRKGNKLEAVKLKKDHSLMGLKEAKDYIDNLCLINIKEEPSSGCFIATACYGDYNSPEVKFFRAYRDNVLIKNYFGRLFVSLYYIISPPIATQINKSDFLKRLIRKRVLGPILNLIQ